MNICTFWVPGHAVTQGSKRAFVTKPRVGKPKAVLVDVNVNELHHWRDAIGSRAEQAMAEFEWPEYVGLRMVFMIRGPSRANRKMLYPIGKRSGDVDKYARAALDALTEVAFEDDCQVIELSVKKRWTQTAAGVRIWIDDLGEYDDNG